MPVWIESQDRHTQVPRGGGLARGEDPPPAVDLERSGEVPYAKVKAFN